MREPLPPDKTNSFLSLTLLTLFFIVLNLFLSTVTQSGNVLSGTPGSSFLNPSLNGKNLSSNALMTLFLLLYNISALVNVSFLSLILAGFVAL